LITKLTHVIAPSIMNRIFQPRIGTTCPNRKTPKVDARPKATKKSAFTGTYNTGP